MAYNLPDYNMEEPEYDEDQYDEDGNLLEEDFDDFYIPDEPEDDLNAECEWDIRG
jgi:hypothetical protein